MDPNSFRYIEETDRNAIEKNIVDALSTCDVSQSTTVTRQSDRNISDLSNQTSLDKFAAKWGTNLLHNK